MKNKLMANSVRADLLFFFLLFLHFFILFVVVSPLAFLVFFGGILLRGAWDWNRFLYVVHMAGGLVIFVPEAGNGRHVVVVLGLGAGIVHGVLAGIFLNIFYAPISPSYTSLHYNMYMLVLYP